MAREMQEEITRIRRLRDEALELAGLAANPPQSAVFDRPDEGIYKKPSFSRYAYAGEDQCLSPLPHNGDLSEEAKEKSRSGDVGLWRLISKRPEWYLINT